MVGSIQVASAQGDHFEVVTSKLSGTQSRLSRSLYTKKEFAVLMLDFYALAMEPSFGLLATSKVTKNCLPNICCMLQNLLYP